MLSDASDHGVLNSLQCELKAAHDEIAKMRGGTKVAAKEEQVTSNFAFATVVSIKAIKRGEKFTKENIWVKRPGVGEISARQYSHILGKISTQNIDADVHLKNEMYE